MSKSSTAKFGVIHVLGGLLLIGLLITTVTNINLQPEPTTTVRDWGIFKSEETFNQSFIPFNPSQPIGDLNLSDIVPEDYKMYIPTGGYTEAFKLNADVTPEEWSWFFNKQTYISPASNNINELAAAIQILSQGVYKLSNRMEKEGLSPRNYDLIAAAKELTYPLLVHPLLDDLEDNFPFAYSTFNNLMKWFGEVDKAIDPKINQRLN